jgi:hypothetical protein
MDHHELEDLLECETVTSGPALLLHYPDPKFDIRYVLVGTCQVDHMANWNGFNEGLEIHKFTVGMHHRDMETTLEIVLVHLLKALSICGTVLSARWLTAVNYILQLSVKKK